MGLLNGETWFTYSIIHATNSIPIFSRPRSKIKRNSLKIPSKWIKAPETTFVCCILNPTKPPSNARNFVTSRQHLSQPFLPPEREKETPKVKAKGEENGIVFPTSESYGKRVQPQAPAQKEKERDEDEEVAKTSPLSLPQSRS